MINVFMVDSNESTIKEVKQYFSNHSSINIKYSCSDGKIALNELLHNYKERSRSEKFSWRKCAEQTIEVYKKWL